MGHTAIRPDQGGDAQLAHTPVGQGIGEDPRADSTPAPLLAKPTLFRLAQESLQAAPEWHRIGNPIIGADDLLVTQSFVRRSFAG